MCHDCSLDFRQQIILGLGLCSGGGSNTGVPKVRGGSDRSSINVTVQSYGKLSTHELCEKRYMHKGMTSVYYDAS